MIRGASSSLNSEANLEEYGRYFNEMIRRLLVRNDSAVKIQREFLRHKFQCDSSSNDI